jgi:hypothetical protein
MQNGKRTQDEKLDKALEDTFPGSDPVSISQPDARQGAPKQHGQTAAQSVKDAARAAKDTARTVKNRAADRIGKIKPEYLWLGGAFLLGAAFAIGAFGASRALPRRSFGDRLLDRGERMQKRVSGRVADMHLKQKLSELLERLH